MESVRNDNYQGYSMEQQQQQQQGQFYIDPAQQQQGGMRVGGAPPVAGVASRPFVDPEAHGEVDPTAYPEPKESTHKIRGRSDLIDMFCNNVNQELLFAKTFYFFFFSAFGSLFPLMAVYFKQMGMNPLQTGFLIGIRPFVEFIAAPFWGSIADRSVLLEAALAEPSQEDPHGMMSALTSVQCCLGGNPGRESRGVLGQVK